MPEGFEHWTASDIKERSQTLKQKSSNDPNHVASERLADYPSDLFMLAHRDSNGTPELHETQADVFVVESGSATLVVGGTLLNAQTVSPLEERNGTIHGGTRLRYRRETS